MLLLLGLAWLAGPGLGSAQAPQTPISARPTAAPMPPPFRILPPEGSALAGPPGNAPAPVTLEKNCPAAVNIGQPLTYELIVRNVAAVAVAQVRVEDELPPGGRFRSSDPPAEVQGDRLSWQLGELQAGAERHIRVEIEPTQEGHHQTSATVTFSASTSTSHHTHVQRPQLTVTKKGPETAVVGDPVPFEIQVTNTGSGPASDVLVRDQLPAGLQHAQGALVEASLGNLAAGESRTVNLQTTAAQPGRQVNEVTVTAAGGIEAKAQAVVVITQPALALRKNGPATCTVDHEVDFDLEASNTGDAPAKLVRVVDTLPDGLDFVAASDAGSYDAQARRVTWLLDTLAAGQHRIVQVKAVARKLGDWTNRATVQGDRLPEVPAAAQPLRVQGVPGLTLHKSGPGQCYLGNEADYELDVASSGTAAAANVRITDIVPDGLTFVSASDGGRYDAGSRHITWNLGTLPAGQQHSLKVKLTASALGDWTNRAVAQGDGVTDVPAEAPPLHVAGISGLTLRKTGPARGFLGRIVEFDLEVANPGSAATPNVVAVDALPDGMEFNAASDGGTYDEANRRVVWQLGTLAPGQRRGLTLRLLAQKGGDWTNQAVAQGDGVPAAPAQAAIHLEGVPALLLEVVDLDDPVEVGAETVYEIRVVNQGSCPTTGLQIVATVPDGMTVRDAAGPTNARTHGQQVIFEPLPVLAARADALYRVRVHAIRPGDWRFKAQMSSDQLRVPVYEEESTRVYNDQE